MQLEAFPSSPSPRGGKAPHPSLPPPAEGQKGGFYLATTNADTMARWAQLDPPPNVGVPVGISWPGTDDLRLVVLDVDVEVPALLDDHVLARHTWVARTPSGGAHVWVLARDPSGITYLEDAGGRPIGELRGSGGYVVAPPSEVDGRPYSWLSPQDDDGLPVGRPLVVDDPLTWALELLQHYDIKGRSTGTQHQGDGRQGERLYQRVLAGEVVREGERHQVALSLAGLLARRGTPKDDAAALLAAVREQLMERGTHDITNAELASVLDYCYDKGAAKLNGDRNGDGAAVGGDAFTDAVAACILAKLLEGQALFVESWGWCTWSGERWQRDPHGALVLRLARETLPKFLREAARRTLHPKRAAELAAWAERAESNARLEAALHLSRGDLYARPAEFDSDPWELNTPAGILDLRTGQVRERTPSDKVTKLAGAAPPQDGGPCPEHAPTWARFLERVLPDPGVRAFVQRAVGYCLTGDVSEQVLFFLFGAGANGKTTFIRTVQALMGDYAIQAAPDLLLTKVGERHPTEVADLKGVRFAATTEVEEGRRLAEVIVKWLTGGDRLKARFMRMDFFEYEPTAKLWLVANHRPEVRGTDYALWRRMLVVPFEVTIPEPERDPRLPEKLRRELDGIMLWALEGLQAWLKDGLAPPPAVLEATEAYRDEMDALGPWLAERTVDDPRAVTAIAALYADYQAWCSAAGETPIPTRAFGRRLSEKGYAPVKLGAACLAKGLETDFGMLWRKVAAA